MNTMTVGDAYPEEQERLRDVLADAVKLSRLPRVNMSFYIAELRAVMAEADAAATSGDPVRIIRAFKAMKEFER